MQHPTMTYIHLTNIPAKYILKLLTKSSFYFSLEHKWHPRLPKLTYFNFVLVIRLLITYINYINTLKK